MHHEIMSYDERVWRCQTRPMAFVAPSKFAGCCSNILFQHIVPTYCSNSLFQHTVPTYCSNTLFQHTVPTHCSNTLFQHTVPTHCSNILFQLTVLTYCSNILYTPIKTRPCKQEHTVLIHEETEDYHSSHVLNVLIPHHGFQ